MPEHVGWQIIHAHEQASGSRRRFTNRDETEGDGITLTSFRDVVILELSDDGDTLVI